jgi:hypothetical protein
LGYTLDSVSPIRNFQFKAGESVFVDLTTDGNNAAQGFYAEAGVVGKIFDKVHGTNSYKCL